MELLPEDSALLCRTCQKKKRRFDTCTIPFIYQPPVANMLQRLKCNRQLIYLRPLARRLMDALDEKYADDNWPEAIIPVPLHWWTLRLRGFNQAGLIARHISKITGIPVLNKKIKRRKTPPQKELSARKRVINIKGAFTLGTAIAHRHVAVVDDVMTTGATVEELCKTLKQAGVRRTDVWCLARTPPAHL